MDISANKIKNKKRILRITAIVCTLVTLLGAVSLALSYLILKDASRAGEFDGIYTDGTLTVEYHGARYSVDDNGNVWEEDSESIRLVAKRLDAKLLAVYDDKLYVLTENEDGAFLSNLSVNKGKLSNTRALEAKNVSSFSMNEKGVYYMANGKILLLEDRSSREIVDLSTLVYKCDDGHSHDCADELSPANADFFAFYDSSSVILYTENPGYIEESELEEGDEIPSDNNKYITFLYDLSEKTLARYLEDTDSSASTLATSTKIMINGVAVPFDKYPPSASYFTKNGRACSCHNANKCLNNASPCNCVRYLSSIGEGNIDLAATQCFGFARYCQYKIFGYFDKPSNASKFTNGLGGSWKAGTFTASKLQDMFLKYGAGGHIRTGGHSLFVISVNATGFTTYECNTSNKDCLVYTRNWTWATFYNYTRYKGIDYYKIPTSFINKVDVTYPTGDYLIEADGGLRLREQPTTGSSILATIPNGYLVKISETRKIDGATTNAWWGKTTYNGKTGWISLDYAKLQSAITGIKITKLPERTTFNQNETFSYSGLEVQLVYAQGTSDTLTGGYTVSTPNMKTAGTHTVTVSYNNFTATYTITVKKSIVLPTKIVFDRPTVTVMTGGEFTPAAGIDYTVLPADAHDKTVEWSVVSGEHLASVNKTTGVVTAVKASSSFVEGYATVRATSLAEDDNGKKVNVYSDYVIEVIKASSDGEWSQPATNIPDGVSLSDYMIEYCATEADYKKGNWKTYDENTTGSAYRYRFKNALKLTWYYDLDSADGNIELPSSFGYPESAMIGERVYVSQLKALTQTNKLFAGWFTTADAAKNLDTAYAYKHTGINADTEFFAGWIDLASGDLIVNASENDPAHPTGKNLLAFGVFEADINVSDVYGGLRFYGHISEALRTKLRSLNSSTVEYGMVVQLASKAGEELRSATSAGYIQDGHSIVVDADLVYGKYDFKGGREYTVFTMLATNIPLESAKTELAARAFIVYYDANGLRRAFYFTNTAENTESLALQSRGVKTSLYECAVKMFPNVTDEEKDWLRENILGHDYRE